MSKPVDDMHAYLAIQAQAVHSALSVPPATLADESLSSQSGKPVNVYDLSALERHLLHAVQTATPGLTLDALKHLTSQPEATVEAGVGTLRSFNLVQAIPGQTITYVLVPLSTEPLFEEWQRYLDSFCDRNPPNVEGDTLGTTFLSVGVVILCAILGGTRDEDEIAFEISLPVEFVRFVLAMVEEHHLWRSLGPFDLERTLLRQRTDLREVELSLQAVEEALWDTCATAKTVAELIELRAGCQFGDGMDCWVDEARYDGWWVN